MSSVDEILSCEGRSVSKISVKDCTNIRYFFLVLDFMFLYFFSRFLVIYVYFLLVNA